jgi:hypothetical protein
LAAVEGEGCEAGDCESGVALKDGVEGWVNLGWLVLACTDRPHTTNMYDVRWGCGGGSLTVDTRLNRILSRCQLCGESEGQRSCNGSKSNANWLHGEESVGLVLLHLPHGRRSCFILVHLLSSWSQCNGVPASSH